MIRVLKIFTLFIVISLSLALPLSVQTSSSEEMFLNYGGNPDDMIRDPSLSNLRSIILDEYAGKDNLTVQQIPVFEEYDGRGNLIVKYEYNVPIENISQYDMNRDYNEYHSAKIDGTCTTVAVTMLTQFYGETKGEFELYNRTIHFRNLAFVPRQYHIDSELWQVFGAIFQIGMARGYMYEDIYNDEIDNTGTLNIVHDNYINYTMDKFGSNNVAYSSYSVYQTIQNETSQGRPVMFNITEHTIIARGYVKFRVVYTETSGILWWKNTETIIEYVDYIIINTGWSTNKDGVYYDYGYFPASKTTTQNLMYNAQRIVEINNTYNFE